MSEGAGPVSAATTPAPRGAGPGLDGPPAATIVRDASIASAIHALRASAADERRRRIAHAHRVAELLRRERAARLAPAETP
jgi:hypothetical protein